MPTESLRIALTDKYGQLNMRMDGDCVIICLDSHPNILIYMHPESPSGFVGYYIHLKDKEEARGNTKSTCIS